MAEFAYKLEASPALGGVDTTVGSVRIRERDDLAIVSIATPQGGERALEVALKSGWGLEMPSPTLSVTSDGARAVRTAPDQMLLIFSHPEPNAEAAVQKKLDGAGYTTEQTDGWVILEVTGDTVHAVLERMSPVDLSPHAFPVNATARTLMAHMGVLVVRTDDKEFLLMSASSSAASLLHEVEISASYV